MVNNSVYPDPPLTTKEADVAYLRRSEPQSEVGDSNGFWLNPWDWIGCRDYINLNVLRWIWEARIPHIYISS